MYRILTAERDPRIDEPRYSPGHFSAVVRGCAPCDAGPRVDTPAATEGGPLLLPLLDDEGALLPVGVPVLLPAPPTLVVLSGHTVGQHR